MAESSEETVLANRVDLLSRVPLFEGINRRYLEEIAKRFDDVSLDKGKVLLREGEHGDCFYLVVRGEIEVTKHTAEGERLLARQGPGEIIGEMALLLNEPRNATATVTKAARLLSMDKAVFDKWVLSNPNVLARLSRTLAARLARAARDSNVQRTNRTILLTNKRGVGGRALVARSIALILHAIGEREVALVRVRKGSSENRSQSKPLRLGVAAVGEIITALQPVKKFGGEVEIELAEGGKAKGNDSAAVLLHELERRFDVVVFDLQDETGKHLFESISDTVIEIVDRPKKRSAKKDGEREGTSYFEVLNLHHRGARPIPINHCFPFVLPNDPGLRHLKVRDAAERILEDRNGVVSIPLHRLVRKLLGATVGIALGGGAAFGISHAGVLQVLEAEGIPVDIIAGTSMGSIIGAGFASGISGRRLVELAHAMGTWRNTLYAVLDFTLTRPALLSGEHLAEVFDTVEGRAESFEDLHRPYRAIGADVETGERVSMGTGSIMLAGRASAAVPIIWSPVRWQGRILIDGSMVDPVPGEVVREMGADICIAVNVVPPLRKGVETVIGRWSRRFNLINPLGRSGEAAGMPNMLDIFMNTIQMLQRELGDYKAIASDVRIHPDLSDFTWIEFYRPQELIERGAEATQRAVPEIRRLLDERLKPARDASTSKARASAGTA
jgi:NTE family protein